jgi:hypothetical protein
MTKPKKKKTIARGVARGLGKLGKGIVTGVVGELASIFTLGLYRPRRRK